MAPVIADWGVLLAGGGGVRMGGVDKGAIHLAGETLAARAYRRLAPQARAVLIASSQRHGWMADLGADIVQIDDVTDAEGEAIGPIGGVLAALEWAARSDDGSGWIATAPIDSPFFPADLVDRLISGGLDQNAPAAYARQGGRDHPAFAVWRASLATAIRREAIQFERRALRHILRGVGAVAVEWNEADSDLFFNINNHKDLSDAQMKAGDRR